jgi:RsiW-degrading membrane proteinase PrsW (M82 family)
MIILIGGFLVSMIPAFAMYFWLKTKGGATDPVGFKQSCREALKNGLLSTVVVLPISALFAFILNRFGMTRESSLLGAFLHTFLVLAFAEELAKSLMLRKTLNKAEYNYTWLDMIALMVIVAIGFEVLESVVYAFGSGPIHMIVRGVTLMHGGYGFIEGWFYGKAKYTGKKWYAVLGFLICVILHGAYDFGLSSQFEAAAGENYAYLSVSLAFFALVVFVWMIIFFAKKNKKPQYTEPLSKSAK